MRLGEDERARLVLQGGQRRSPGDGVPVLRGRLQRCRRGDDVVGRRRGRGVCTGRVRCAAAAMSSGVGDFEQFLPVNCAVFRGSVFCVRMCFSI